MKSRFPSHVKLRDGETVTGWIEYFDDRMIRLTREGKPNLFIYKHQIRTITEQTSRHGSRNAIHARLLTSKSSAPEGEQQVSKLPTGCSPGVRRLRCKHSA